MVLVISFLFALACGLVAADPSPRERVVNLVTELKERIVEDRSNEQKVYDKYACWCEKTLKRKADTIHAAKEEIAALQHQVLETKSRLAVLAAEIQTTKQEMTEIANSREDATALRKRESEEYMQEQAELNEAIAALGKAIEVLGGVQRKPQQAEQETAFLATLPAIRHALQLPAAKEMSSAKLQLLSSFLASTITGSSTILGILKSMDDTFKGNLVRLEKQEKAKQEQYKVFLQDTSNQLKSLEEALAAKEGEQADKMKAEAESKSQLADTVEQRDSDEAFFADAAAGCKNKADEWHAREQMRDDELSGIQKALDFLASDEAQQLFLRIGKRQAPELLQVSAHIRRHHTATKAQHMWALNQLRNVQGRFEKVLKAINKTLKHLKDEAQQDIKQRDWCIEELHQTKLSLEELSHAYTIQSSKIDKLSAKSNKLAHDMQKTHEELEQVNATISTAHDDRNSAAAAYNQSRTANLAAVELLGHTISELQAFFKSGEGDVPSPSTALIQTQSVVPRHRYSPLRLLHRHRRSSALLRRTHSHRYGHRRILASKDYKSSHSSSISSSQEPTFDVDPDQAPETKFSDTKSTKGQTDSVLGMISYVKDKIESDIEAEEKDEQEAIEQFGKVMADLKTTQQSLQAKYVELEGAKADVDMDLGETLSGRNTTSTTQSDTETHKNQIKPGCDWLMASFDARAQHRAEERDALTNAKSVLKGASMGKALLQNDRVRSQEGHQMDAEDGADDSPVVVVEEVIEEGPLLIRAQQ
ncbi:unnamed protein product [Vitrella brassicaformis CCMP3155]|uniref:Uncharacterized protein n=1 Tax=Vitrella brassicaformis (strain CCMP3155) TaxID=1169540 RepID=A0A0G4EN77_VITBC|nr:unnamed protein product [Vitrella brassicaformis CCMP3155]|eukprot:CEL98576.1 unnamed protein product [Vitrella brassicaformis CCMP3155]